MPRAIGSAALADGRCDLGTDPDGYPIELPRGFVETPERLAFLTAGPR